MKFSLSYCLLFTEGGSHGVNFGQKDEQGGLGNQRLTSCQTQGTVVFCCVLKIYINTHIHTYIHFFQTNELMV